MATWEKLGTQGSSLSQLERTESLFVLWFLTIQVSRTSKLFYLWRKMWKSSLSDLFIHHIARDDVILKCCLLSIKHQLSLSQLMLTSLKLSLWIKAMGRWSFSARILQIKCYYDDTLSSPDRPGSPGAPLVRAADHGLLPPGYILLDPPEHKSGGEQLALCHVSYIAQAV